MIIFESLLTTVDEDEVVVEIPWSQKSGNTEQGKCQLTNEYPFFLFLIGLWYYEKNIIFFMKTIYSSRYSYVACNSRYA